MNVCVCVCGSVRARERANKQKFLVRAVGNVVHPRESGMRHILESKTSRPRVLCGSCSFSSRFFYIFFCEVRGNNEWPWKATHRLQTMHDLIKRSYYLMQSSCFFLRCVTGCVAAHTCTHVHTLPNFHDIFFFFFPLHVWIGFVSTF